jgi:hypothetical protein
VEDAPGGADGCWCLVTALVGGVVGLKQAGIIFSEGKPPAQGEVRKAGVGAVGACQRAATSRLERSCA